MSAVVQSAINVSEGRRVEVVEAVADAVRGVVAATLADYSADEDHNRMVVTVLGGPDAVVEACLEVARVAVSLVDMRRHHGAHPRTGAIDVIPLTPLRDITLASCVEMSRRLGELIGHELHLPVFYYEASAFQGRSLSLPDVRKGGFEGLFAELFSGLKSPDTGPHHPHPTAGAVIVGARMPLVAYNIDLDTADVSEARRIAGSIRKDRDIDAALRGVRALGLGLEKKGRAQISMNVTRPDETPLPAIFDYVVEKARLEGIQVFGSEIIGLTPQSSLGGEPPGRIRWQGYRETQIVEYWLDRL